MFKTLFRVSLQGERVGGGLLAYNYLSGEPITGLAEGRPLFLRSPDSTFNLATSIRTHLFAALATLRIGMDVLQKDEGVQLETMFSHGGLFTTKGVAQQYLTAAIDTPVSIGDTALRRRRLGHRGTGRILTQQDPGQSLADYLRTSVSTDAQLVTVQPDPDDVTGFEAFMQRYLAGLPV